MPSTQTLHPFDDDDVARFVAALLGRSAAESVVPGDPAWSARTMARALAGHARALEGREEGANAVTLAFARTVATRHPTFVLPSAGLSVWESRVDRGVGMLLRPPSRLFGEAGVPTAAARAMPIRLDAGGGTMGGAFVPARLVPDLRRLLDERGERMVRRLVEAEMDGVGLVGQFTLAAQYAADHGLGLFEAAEAVLPEMSGVDPPGSRVVVPDRRTLDPALRHRLEEAAKPPKKPGLLGRLLGTSRGVGKSGSRGDG